jgi:hypothetical protein
LQSKRAALDFLNNIVDTSESSKVLRNSSKWQTKDKKYQLAELIYTDEKLAWRLMQLSAQQVNLL